MSNKAISILIVLCLGIVSLIALQYYLPTLIPSQNSYTKSVKGIKTDTVNSIEIKKGDLSVKLTRDASGWKANDKRGDAEKITELLGKLITNEKSELVAQTDKRHKEFELTDELATKISLGGAALLAGSATVDGVYIRVEGSQEVFLVKNLLSNDVSSDPKDWYDRTIVKIEEKNLKSLAFDKPEEKFTLVQENSVWKLKDENKDGNKDVLSPLLVAISAFKAQELADETTVKSYPTKPALTLTIETQDKKEALLFFKKDSNYLVKRNSDSEHFVIGEYMTKDFLVTKSSLLTASTPTP